ncbi:MAG: 16S rRNA (cytosine(967)-C(5))-methyltransferase, partial [Planctomycetaceae bacterium]
GRVFLNRTTKQFDAILIDVPCSNTGVLGRRPEARWRADEESLEELIRIQTRLLLQAVERVRPGGRIVYSTCSMEPEENEGVVRSVMSVLKDWSVSSPQQHLPGQPADGACQILLTRNS